MKYLFFDFNFENLSLQLKLTTIFSNMTNYGKVSQVIGPVVDVTFSGEGFKLPEIYNALEIKRAHSTLV